MHDLGPISQVCKLLLSEGVQAYKKEGWRKLV